MIHYRELKKKTLQNIVKKIKALENQIEGLKKENQVFKEILTSKLAINNGNNNNIDNSWKTVKANHGTNVDNKDNNRRFNSIDVRNKLQPLFIHENEVTEPHVNNRLNNDANEYVNTFNNNIDNNATTPKTRSTSVTNQYPEIDTLGVSKQSKNVIPGYTKYNEAVRFGRKEYVLGTSMVKGIRRNEFNSCLKKYQV